MKGEIKPDINKEHTQIKNDNKIRRKIDTCYQNIKHTWQSIIARFLKSSLSSLGLARFFSWIFFVLIIVFSVFLSIFVGTTTRNSLINSQESYSLLFAQNLNKQIFRRFNVPVAISYGRVALSEPDQYKLLNEVIDDLRDGLYIESIRIFDANEIVAFSTNKEEVRSSDLSNVSVQHVFATEKHSFEVISTMSFFEVLFRPNIPKGSFIFRTVYPLTIDFEFGAFKLKDDQKDVTILGALEILQDVTSLYERAAELQRTIFAGFIISILILFSILQIIARTAERVISERIKQNKELEKELHQSEKLASMGRMVASIAHEVRNPLGIIKSSSEYLLNRKDADSTEKKLLGAIFDETSRLSVTVNDFLDYARPRDLGKDTVDIVSVINTVWGFLENSFEQKNINVSFHLSEELKIIGDVSSLYRAIYNIFINAEQAMENGGNFDIEGFKTRSGEIKIRFIDDGCGFSKNVDKVLDPFFTTKDTGTGLGLPIVQNIIKSHNGNITLSNNDAGGAVVEIIFEVSKK